MLKPTDKVVCCCRKGQVRSVAARRILIERHGFRNVLSFGLENTDDFWKEMLFGYANHVLVVGGDAVWCLLPDYWRYKALWLDVGRDVWGNPMDYELDKLLSPMIERLVKI